MRRVSVILVAVVTLLALTSATVYAKPMEWTTICNHVVQPGQTIWCIARGYGVSPWAIIAHNGLVNPSLIYPGMVLAIPNAPATLPAGPTCTPQCGGPPPPTCTCAYYHTVVPGSNLFRISLLYGVSMWSIAECNGILNLNLIRAGAVLCIPADP
jgi:spore germination protein